MLIDPTGQKPSIIIDVTVGEPSKFTCSTNLPGEAAEESEKTKRNKWKAGGLDGALGQSARKL